MAPDSIWEIVFLMVILKIPIAYLVWVVWWAVKAEPRPEEGASVTVVTGPDAPSDRQRRSRSSRRPWPHGGPSRRPARTAGALASARAKLSDE